MAPSFHISAAQTKPWTVHQFWPAWRRVQGPIKWAGWVTWHQTRLVRRGRRGL